MSNALRDFRRRHDQRRGGSCEVSGPDDHGDALFARPLWRSARSHTLPPTIRSCPFSEGIRFARSHA
jgi:hypothetical protein